MAARERGLVCAFGTPWVFPHVCAACDAFTDQGRQEFQDAVKAGRFDVWGFTKQEAKSRKPKQLEFVMEAS